MLKNGISFYLARKRILSAFFIGAVAVFGLVGCNDTAFDQRDNSEHISNSIIIPARNSLVSATEKVMSVSEDEVASQQVSQQKGNEASSNALITKDTRTSFDHGAKGPEFQKYIVLHDTEGDGSASGVIDWWDSNGTGVAAHFVINKDGSIVQCVELDRIAHHAGYGDTGHNQKYGTVDESRDDKVGTKSIGSWASDYGMNSYSVGIELVHVGGSGGYPKAQLEALDNLISYIDTYYGFESQIIDHKAWRSGNSDTSKEFSQYLANYQDHRSYA